MQPVNTFILIKWKIPAQRTADHPPRCPPLEQQRARVRETSYEEEVCRDLAGGPCASSALHSQPLHTIFLDRGAGGEEDGHRAGREARCHLLLKVRVVRLDRAGGSRTMVPSIAGTFPRMIKQVFLFRPLKPTSSSHPSPCVTRRGQKNLPDPTQLHFFFPLGIVSRTGTGMDVESSPARSQPCLSQQVFKKKNKQESPP